MRRSREELRLLASEEFNNILSADPELARLRRLVYNRALESRVLLEVLGIGYFKIGDLPVRPLTIAKIAMLWMLASPFVIGGEVTESDLDVAYFLLAQPDLRRIPAAPAEIPAAAAGFAASTGLDFDEAVEEVKAMFQSAFAPLTLLPDDDDDAKNDEEPHYDGEWAIAYAGVAARESGMPLDYCLHEMSFSTVAGCVVNQYRRDSIDGSKIQHRPSAEISAEIDARIDELANRFLADRRRGNNAPTRTTMTNEDS